MGGDLLRLMCMQGASHYANMCLKIEELLPVSALPLLSVAGYGYGERNIKASARRDLVVCVNRSIQLVFLNINSMRLS